MAIKFDESAHTFDELAKKYNDFYAPTVTIKIDGSNLNLSQIPVSSIQVTSTTGPKADSFQFRVENGYNQQERKFDWVGSTIKVGKSITVALGYKDKLEDVFDGYVTGITLEYPDDGNPSVVVRGMDRSMFMMRGSHSKLWHKKTVSDVVKEIAGENSLTPQVDSTTPQKEIIEQMQTSDFLFVKQLASDLNYEFFVVGNKLIFRKRKTSGTPVLTLSYGMNLKRFSVDVDISNQISKVTVRGLDHETHKSISAVSQTVNKIGSNSKTGKDIVASLTSRMEETLYSVSGTQGELQTLANAKLNERAMELVSGEGECIGIPELRAGRFIKLDGLGNSFNQPYFMNQVTHTLDDRGYFTTFQVEGNAVNV